MTKLESEKVVVEAPMSFTGSCKRIWHGVEDKNIGWKIVGVLGIMTAWSFILGWYLVFGILVIPYRLLRRGSRKRKKEALQHRELLEAIQAKK